MNIIFNHRHDVEVWFQFDVVDRLACVCIVGVGGVCGVVVVFECRFGVFWLVGGGFFLCHLFLRRVVVLFML